MQDLTGQTLGQYRIVEPLGRGGMASVFKAFQPSLERYVAIKVLPPYYVHEPGFAERFVREARAVARLEHPHILPVYDFGQEGDYTYIVMKYVSAGTLKNLILGGPMVLELAVRIISQLAQALDYAHQQGIVHRDVKPSNVLMDRSEWALLMDFGLAKMVEGSVQLTASGVGVGTPAYMAPEQGQGKKVDCRADIYSLGVVLYEMLTGRVPFDAETPMAVVIKHITEPLPMPRAVNAAIPEQVELVILKALAKSPEDRYQTCAEMSAALTRALEDTASFEGPEASFLDTLAFDEPVTLDAEPLPPLDEIELIDAFPSDMVIGDQPAMEPGPASVSIVEPVTKPAAEPVPERQVEPAPGVPSLSPEAATAVERATPSKPAAVRGKRKIPWWAFAGGAVALLAVVAVIVLAATGAFTPGEDEYPPYGDVALDIEPPEGAMFVEPCDGPALCVMASNGELLVRLLENIDLEFTGRPAWSPDGRRIVFAAVEPGGRPELDSGLYIVNVDGSGLIELPRLGNDVTPAWSPDGAWLAFHSSGNLAVMQLDGTDGKIIWHVEDEKIAGPPQWSPDSQRVVFAAVSPQEREIQVISLEGKEVTHIAGMTGGFEQERSDTAFDPSGRNVVYYDSDYPSWMIADAEGEEDAEPIDIEALPALWTGAYYPQWGNEELLARSEPLTGEPAGSGFPGEPVRVAPCDWDGSGSGLCIYSLVEERAPARILEDAGFEHIDGVSWSPEGQQLVLAGTRPDAGSDVGNALFVVNVNGSGLIQITHSGNSVNPSWGPDGEWIVFHYNCDLGRIHSDGSDLQVIWQGQGRCVFSPQWSPGGEQIVFSAIPNGEWQFPLEREVIVIGRDGTDPRSIVMTAHDSEAHFGHEVAFSPDQSHIAYLDGENRARIVYLENGETERVQDFPYGWMSTQHPQWGHD